MIPAQEGPITLTRGSLLLSAGIGIGFVLGYARAILDSELIAERISDLADAVREASEAKQTESIHIYTAIDQSDVIEGTATEINYETPEGEPIR